MIIKNDFQMSSVDNNTSNEVYKARIFILLS